MPYEKVGKNEPVCIADEVPFEIPDSWEWVRIKNCCIDIFSGKSPKYIKSKTNFHIIGQAANQNNGLDFSQCKYTDDDFWSSMDEKYFLRKYDVLLNTLGNGTLGRSGIVTDLPFPMLTDGHLFIFRTNEDVVGWYLYLYLQYRKPEIEKSANGSTNQTFLNLTKTMEWLVPLPPIDEQIRIVEKYKSLTPILETYSSVYNSCIHLNKTFPEQLKKSILQEAVQGKLVPQDENDEPASVLLERIRAEKQKLIAEGKIKKDKHESVIFRRDNSHYEKLDGIERCIDDEIPFDIPDSWHWVRLGCISTYAHTKEKINAQNANAEIWGLDLEDIEKGGRLIQKLTVGQRKSVGDKTVFYKGDILYSKLRPYLLKTLIADDDGVCSPEIIPFSTYCNIKNEFVILYLKSPYVDNFINAITYGVKMPRVGTETMVNLLIPLPPLAEQQRIVDAYNSLIPYIEEL